MPAPTWTLPQMMWLKANEPESLAKTEHVLFVKDYVRYLLTGEAATDHIEAQGTLMWDMPGTDWASGANGNWDAELVALSGLKMSAMPKIIAPTDVVGRVVSAAAAATGLPEGVPVVCGSSDSAVEDYGAGAVEPGDLIIKLATAGNVNAMTASAHPHPKTLTYSHIVPGMWYSVSATNAAALCMRWFRDAFFLPVAGKTIKSAAAQPVNATEQFNNLKVGEADRFKAAAGGDLTSKAAVGGDLTSKAAAGGDLNLYSVIDKEASGSPIGSNGVMFHPYLQGERCPYWDANLRASFTGVSISSMRGDFARAVMEGVAFSLRDCYRTLEEMKLPVKRIFLIGGGARSRVWSEIVANVFDCAVAVPQPGDASFGACLLAGVGVGIFADVKEAVAKCLRIDRAISPDPSAAVEYARLFDRYRRIHDALAPVYAQSR